MEDSVARAMAMDAAQNGGSGGLDTSEFVKRTDYATNSVAGLVKPTQNEASRTIGVNADGSIYARIATEQETKTENTQYRALVPSLIPIFMSNYGIKSKTMIDWILERLNDLDKKGTEEPAAAAAHAVVLEKAEMEQESEDEEV